MRRKPIEQILLEVRRTRRRRRGRTESDRPGHHQLRHRYRICRRSCRDCCEHSNKELKDVHWLRLMYAYPSCFTDEMIDTIAECIACVKYIDMPLQHINDEMLTKMKRRVTRKQIETLLDKLRLDARHRDPHHVHRRLPRAKRMRNTTSFVKFVRKTLAST